MVKVLHRAGKPLAGLAGFEPTMSESKSDALPLGYSPIFKIFITLKARIMLNREERSQWKGSKSSDSKGLASFLGGIEKGGETDNLKTYIEVTIQPASLFKVWLYSLTSRYY